MRPHARLPLPRLPPPLPPGCAAAARRNSTANTALTLAAPSAFFSTFRLRLAAGVEITALHDKTRVKTQSVRLRQSDACNRSAV